MTGFCAVCSRNERTNGKAREAFDDFSLASRSSSGLGLKLIESCGAFYGVVHHTEFSNENFAD